MVCQNSFNPLKNRNRKTFFATYDVYYKECVVYNYFIRKSDTKNEKAEDAMDKSLKPKMKTILFAVLLIVLMLAIQFVAAFFAGIAVSLGTVLTGNNLVYESLIPISVLLSQIACLIVFGIWYYTKYVKKDKNEGVYESGLKKILHFKDLAFIIALSVAGFFFANIVSQIEVAVMPEAGKEFESMMENVLGNGSIIGVISAALLAPISEEIVFRGLLVKNAKKVFGITGCILLSGIAFGIVHLNPIQSIYAIPLGMLLAYLAYRYSSIIPAILLHMINNSLSVFLPKIYHGNLGYIACAVLCLVFLAAAVVIKKYFLKKN